jgi:imidazolonepropionase-like amidohydrolase
VKFSALCSGLSSWLAVALLATVSLLHAQQQQPATATVVRAARLIDPRTGNVMNNPVVVVSGGRILSVGSNAAIPADARVVDLGNLTLLPGLIDAHTHLLQNYNGQLGGDDPNMLLTVATMSTAKRALLGAKTGREDLEAGITTVRDLGNSGFSGDVALRDAVNAGWVVGPRIRASTRAISAAGGQFGPVQPETQKLIEQEYVVVSSVDDARRAVRQAFYDGADLIKVIVNTGPRVVSLDEMRAIVEEARRVNRTVAAHAIGDTATRIAAEAGVASIEHAYSIPDEVLRMMAQKGIYLVPTDYPADFYVSAFGPSALTPEQQRQQRAGAAQFAKGNGERLMRAVRAGVKQDARSGEPSDAPGLPGGGHVAARGPAHGNRERGRVVRLGRPPGRDRAGKARRYHRRRRRPPEGHQGPPGRAVRHERGRGDKELQACRWLLVLDAGGRWSRAEELIPRQPATSTSVQRQAGFNR